MQQLSLVEKPKEKKAEAQQHEKQITKTISDSRSMWSKINIWLENCKQQKENFAYFTVEYRANVHLDGSKDEYLSTSTTMERPAAIWILGRGYIRKKHAGCLSRWQSKD